MKLDQLIEELERGVERAEAPTWIAFSISADAEADELLADLKRVRAELAQKDPQGFI